MTARILLCVPALGLGLLAMVPHEAAAQCYSDGQYRYNGTGGIAALLSMPQRQAACQQAAQAEANRRAAIAYQQQQQAAQAQAQLQEQQAQAQRDAEAERAREVIQERRDQEARAREREAASQQAERARIEVAQQAQRQRDAEDSPDNICKSPMLAKAIMEEFNQFPGPKSVDLQAIDMEHVTTISADPEKKTFSCHTTMVFNRGSPRSGVFTMRPNIAGDMISAWRAD